MSKKPRTIQLHPERRQLCDVSEHLNEPAAKLFALERLLSCASGADGDSISSSVEGKDAKETVDDFLLGLSLLIRDTREELEQLALEEDEDEERPAAAGGAR